MKKSNLRVTAAWQALALLGAGAPAAFVAATPAAAQDYTRGNIVGTVTDAQGAPVAGAQVTVRNNDQGFTTTTTTDANGVFRATALNTGTYTVTVVANGQTVVEDRGVVVQAICPQGVRTRMLEDAGGLQDLLSHDQALAPEDVAEAAMRGLADDRFLILPHPEVAGYYAGRATDTEHWLAAMRKAQAVLDAPKTEGS